MILKLSCINLKHEPGIWNVDGGITGIFISFVIKIIKLVLLTTPTPESSYGRQNSRVNLSSGETHFKEQ